MQIIYLYFLGCILIYFSVQTVVVEVDMGAVGAGIIIEMVDLIDINMAETVHGLIERISQSSRIYVMRIVV